MTSLVVMGSTCEHQTHNHGVVSPLLYQLSSGPEAPRQNSILIYPLGGLSYPHPSPGMPSFCTEASMWWFSRICQLPATMLNANLHVCVSLTKGRQLSTKSDRRCVYESYNRCASLIFTLPFLQQKPLPRTQVILNITIC